MRRPLLALLVGAGLAAACTPHAASVSCASLPAEQALLGAWRVVRMETVRSDGSTLPDRLVADQPRGLLVYTASGHVSAQIMRVDRPHVEDGRRRGVELDAAAANALLNGYLAYFGTFQVDPHAATIIHHIEGTLHSGTVGSRFVRYYDLAGDRLVLTTPEFVEQGEKRRTRVTFERTQTPPAPRPALQPCG